MGGILFSFLMALSAQAQFRPAAEGLLSNSLNPALADAVVKVVATNPDGLPMQCTGAYISDQGHILTGSHCLELALFGRPVLDPAADQNLLKLEVNDRVGEWRVRLISPCRRPDIVASLPEEMALVSIRDCEYYDLAILEPTRPQSVPVCLEVFQAALPEGEVFTLGYPIRTFRLREPNSMGDQVYYSSGELGASAVCKIVASPSVQRVGHSFSLDQALDRANQENAVQASLDVVAGNSGGPVFDKKTGTPVAVVSFATTANHFDPRRERCEAGGSFITSLQHLPRAFKVWSPKENWADFVKATACNARRAK